MSRDFGRVCWKLIQREIKFHGLLGTCSQVQSLASSLLESRYHSIDRKLREDIVNARIVGERIAELLAIHRKALISDTSLLN